MLWLEGTRTLPGSKIKAKTATEKRAPSREVAAPLPILGAGGALGSSGGRRRGCFPSRSTLEGRRPRGCTAPEPCRKISEALCFPAGDTTQRCRRTALGDTAMAEPRSQGAWPLPSTSRGRARRHAALAWVCACAEEGFFPEVGSEQPLHSAENCIP